MNRLQNTVSLLATQAENLQASESRISDVDVATEMSILTRNQILAQAGTAMLTQANTIPQMALTLLR
jgi:flagellin